MRGVTRQLCRRRRRARNGDGGGRGDVDGYRGVRGLVRRGRRTAVGYDRAGPRDLVCVPTGRVHGDRVRVVHVLRRPHSARDRPLWPLSRPPLPVGRRAAAVRARRRRSRVRLRGRLPRTHQQAPTAQEDQIRRATFTAVKYNTHVYVYCRRYEPHKMIDDP